MCCLRILTKVLSGRSSCVSGEMSDTIGRRLNRRVQHVSARDQKPLPQFIR
jgi:hypothetical protein